MMVTNRCSMLLGPPKIPVRIFGGGLPTHYETTHLKIVANQHLIRNLWFFQIPLLPYHQHLWRLWMQMACVVAIQLGSSMRWSSWILIRRWVDRLLRVQYGAVTMENPQWRCISYWALGFSNVMLVLRGVYWVRDFLGFRWFRRIPIR